MTVGYYSAGMAGFRVWPDPATPERMIAQYCTPDGPAPSHSYKVHVAPSGRAYIRPYGHRVYLDQILRMEVPTLEY